MGVMRRSSRHAIVAGGALLVAAAFPAAGVQASAGQPTAARVVAASAGVRSAVPAPDRLPAGLARPGIAQAGLSLTILGGVFCTSARNCWAVGEREASSGSAVLNQILHWNGKSWREAPVPNPAGTGANAMNGLFAVRCLSAANCWTVGEYSRNSGALALTQALRWNGRKWAKVATPNPAGTKTGDNNELFDVTCISSANCWSVGDFGTPPDIHQKLLNLVLHWNGKHWSRVRLSNPGGTTANHLNSLSSVRCGSARNCNAVGDYGTAPGGTYQLFNQAFHWNGKRWSHIRTPNPGGSGFGHFSQIDALACGSGSNCWGAGSYGTFEPTFTARNEILHWNGRKWTKSTVANPAGTAAGDINELVGATCSSTGNCWAVGGRSTAVGAMLNEALHWNGKRWSVVFTPSPGGTGNGQMSTLLAARCTSKSNCWAVGYKLATPSTYLNEILHWNGRTWSVHAAPGS